MGRDANSAAVLLTTAITLLADGKPPLAVEWQEVEATWSFHRTDPWARCRAAPLVGDVSELKKFAMLETPPRAALRRAAAEADRDWQVALQQFKKLGTDSCSFAFALDSFLRVQQLPTVLCHHHMLATPLLLAWVCSTLLAGSWSPHSKFGFVTQQPTRRTLRQLHRILP